MTNAFDVFVNKIKLRNLKSESQTERDRLGERKKDRQRETDWEIVREKDRQRVRQGETGWERETYCEGKR